MPARYDTIIVVRKRNARGDEVEYHTVGRRGPSIWRTGEPNPPGTPGYQAAYDAAIGLQAAIEPPATGHGWRTVDDLLDAYERSREFCGLAPRTRADYLRGLADVRAKYGSAPLGIVNSVAIKGNVLDWVEARWAGKVADLRLNAFKFALSWASFRHPERVAVNYLNGIPCFYRGAEPRGDHLGGRRGRAVLPAGAGALRGRGAARPRDRPAHRRPRRARAQRDQVGAGRRAGGRAAAEQAPQSDREHAAHRGRRGDRRQGPAFAPPDPEAGAGGGLGRRPSVPRGPRLRDRFGIRRELRFNDLRGTKVTELVWAGISVPELAVRMGWGLETAAKMAGVYAALNPGRAMVVALPGPARQDDATS